MKITRKKQHRYRERNREVKNKILSANLEILSKKLEVKAFFSFLVCIFPDCHLDYHFRQQGHNLDPLANRCFFPMLDMYGTYSYFK